MAFSHNTKPQKSPPHTSFLGLPGGYALPKIREKERSKEGRKGGGRKGEREEGTE